MLYIQLRRKFWIKCILRNWLKMFGCNHQDDFSSLCIPSLLFHPLFNHFAAVFQPRESPPAGIPAHPATPAPTCVTLSASTATATVLPVPDRAPWLRAAAALALAGATTTMRTTTFPRPKSPPGRVAVSRTKFLLIFPVRLRFCFFFF